MSMTHQSQGLFKTLRQGRGYMKSWPSQERGLAAVFPEHNVIKIVRFAVLFMPLMAIFSLCWSIAFDSDIIIAFTVALFACSIPAQGLWWLGLRSVTPLPSSLIQWYNNIYQQLLQAGFIIAPVEGALTYQHLADLLKQAFTQIDRTFMDDL